MRSVGRSYGAQAEILAMAEGAVLTVRRGDGPAYHDTIRVGPELTRLDLVSKARHWGLQTPAVPDVGQRLKPRASRDSSPAAGAGSASDPGNSGSNHDSEGDSD